jgi:predicted nucleic acid-binding protein
MIILDTNVVSELMRSEPSPQVADWVRRRDRRELRMTSITLAEIRFGIARLPAGRRKQVLLDAADDTFRDFDEQILPVDAAAAEQYAIIASSRERAGRPIAGFDALIAAVCRSRDAALATRNVHDFDGTGIEIVNPWTPQAVES